MTRDQVVARLVSIMEDVFDVDDLQYSDDLNADVIDDWDSLSHIRFMVAVERAFGIRFATGEIDKFRNVGELVSAIEPRVG
jgi:acyl carrier protein